MRTKNKRIRFRLDDKELELLNRQVEKSGLNRSEYCRHMINDIIPNPDYKMPDYADYKNKLHDIGVKINHVAMVANATGIIDIEKYDDVVLELTKTLDEFLKEVTVPQHIR
jgi:hypothetical protein